MRLVSNLLEAAGISDRRLEVSLLAIGSAALVATVSYFASGVLGLALCFAVLIMVIWLEAIRTVGSARQKRLDLIWPSIFDALKTGSQAGLLMAEQVEYLATDGPEQLRREFALLSKDLERGIDSDAALANFRGRVGSRSGDFLAIVMSLTQEIGGRGEAANWEQAAKDIRLEQVVLSQVRAKQSWVLASAKIALLAPWLICVLLLNLEQNRAAFASPQGSLVLVFGLVLSLCAYFLTGVLGKLRLPERVFHVG